MVGRDGSVPIMVCLVLLINKDPLHSFTHNMKVKACSNIVRFNLPLCRFATSTAFGSS